MIFFRDSSETRQGSRGDVSAGGVVPLPSQATPSQPDPWIMQFLHQSIPDENGQTKPVM